MKLYFNSNLTGEKYIGEVSGVKEAYTAMQDYLYAQGYRTNCFISQLYSTNNLEIRYSIGQGGEGFVLRNK